MTLLWIDTVSQACSVAVGDKKKLYAFENLPVKQGQAEKLAPVIKNVLLQASLKIDDIQKIAVTRGPGSFTAVRIGLAVARMLAQVLHIPCLGISNFELMWQQALFHQMFLSSDQYNALSIHSFRAAPFIQITQKGELIGKPMGATDEIIKSYNFKKVIINEEKDYDFWKSHNMETKKLKQANRTHFLHHMISYYISISDEISYPAIPLYIRDADAKASIKNTKKLIVS